MNEIIDTFQNMTYDEIVSQTEIILNTLHFIRADWFYAFIPLIIFLIFSSKKSLAIKSWRSTIDAQLLPFVLTKNTGKKRRYPLFLTFIAASLCITALAGPVYKKLPQPVYREQSSLVILLDLSQSMNATDIKPSRLARSKLELLDILKTRKTGQTALIVYAADAFVVTPLTDDNATIANLIPSLETSMMPAQGSNLSIALAKTFSLFTQAGIIKGNILVITDGIHQRDEKAIKKVSSQGHRLSIFGIGTTNGAPIPLDESHGGGFLQDNKGAIVIPKLHPAKLQTYALSGSGIYTGLQANDDDVDKLTRLFQSKKISKSTNTQNNSADIWQEEGHLLLLPLLFFAALWTRKGWLAALLPFTIIYFVAMPKTAYAESIDVDNLWTSPDQKAMQAFNAGDHNIAAEKFTQPEWKASAHYRNGNYESAAKALEGIEHSEAYYNKANALAKLGQYKEAIETYNQALELDESNDDAAYNRDLVQQALEQQKKDQSQQDSSEQNDEQSEDSKSDDSQSDDSKSQDSEKQDSASDSDKNKDGDQKSQDSSEKEQNAEQQKNEEQQLKQRDAKKEQEKAQEEKQQYEQDQKESQDNNEAENKEIENNEIENKDSDDKPAEIEINPTEASISEEEKATEQWLKRIPDDPGGLLRRKFLYQYKQTSNKKDDIEPW